MKVRALTLALLLLAAGPALGAGPDAVWVPTLPLGVQGTDHITAFPDGTVYELHTAGGIGGFYRSKDYGVSWTPLTFPPTDGFGQVGFVSPTLGYAADVAGVHRTVDGAGTWTATAPLPVSAGHTLLTIDGLGVAKRRDALYVSAPEYAPLTTGCNEPADYLLWSSHDGGRHWRRVSLGTNHATYWIKALDDRTAAAIVYDLHPDGPCGYLGDRNAVYVTHDGGRSWQRALSCPTGHLCTTAAFLTPTHLLVGRNEGSTASSTDGGRTFHPGPSFRNNLPTYQDSSQYFWVQGFAFATSNRGWVSVKGVGTYRTDDAGARWTLEHSQDEGWGLDVGDASAADAQHAVIAGPTLVSTRIPNGSPQRTVRATPATLTATAGTFDLWGRLHLAGRQCTSAASCSS